MTPLQQRFLDAIEKDIALEGSQYDDAIKAAAACEKIAEEFAIEFLHWYLLSDYFTMKEKEFTNDGNTAISINQLIQQFKEQGK